jgi:Xaa-Pro aminopeptidase
MERRGIDVALLSRPEHVRYASGAARVWTAGARPLTPACAVIRRSGEVHVAGINDAGIPGEMPAARRHATAWDVAGLVELLAQIPGVAEARCLAVDGGTPRLYGLLADRVRGASLVDAAPLMDEVRGRKTAAEVAAIAAAIAVAEKALSATLAELDEDVSGEALAARFLEVMCAEVPAVPAMQPRFDVVGETLVADVAVLVEGYEGGLGRTWPIPADRSLGSDERALWRRRLWEALAVELRPGRGDADLRGAFESAGEPLPAEPIAQGIGLGLEAPIAAGTSLQADMVVSVALDVRSTDGAMVRTREIVAITEGGHRLLTGYPHHPW